MLTIITFFLLFMLYTVGGAVTHFCKSTTSTDPKIRNSLLQIHFWSQFWSLFSCLVLLKKPTHIEEGVNTKILLIDSF